METKNRVPLCLKDIVQYELSPIFRVQHLNPDLIVGFIGDRGGGKSIGGGTVSLYDFMLQADNCLSNTEIAATFQVSDDIAGKYGLKGGSASFRSHEIDMEKFLKGDTEEYNAGCYFIDEINIALADGRRAMSNQNLQAADVGQQLRKQQAGLIYTCISEMFVESRIRDMTDIFVQTIDTALTKEGMEEQKGQGREFAWTIYPMTRKGAAILRTDPYSVSHQVVEGWTLKGKPLWGLIGTFDTQRRTKYKVPINSGLVESISIIENPKITEFKDKWYFISEKVIALKENLEKAKTMSSDEINEALGITAHGRTISEFSDVCSTWQIERKLGGRRGGVRWVVEPGETIIPAAAAVS